MLPYEKQKGNRVLKNIKKKHQQTATRGIND